MFGVIFGAYHWLSRFVSATPATAGTVMVAVLPLILGVQMLLQGLALEVQASPGAEETRRLGRMEEDPGLVWDGEDEAAERGLASEGEGPAGLSREPSE